MGMGLRLRLGKIYLGTSSVYFKCNPLYSSVCVCVLLYVQSVVFVLPKSPLCVRVCEWGLEK